jgi:hypothetical protein
LGGAADVMFFFGLRTLEEDALGLATALVAVFAATFFSTGAFLGASFSLDSVLLALGASLTLPLGPEVRS